MSRILFPSCLALLIASGLATRTSAYLGTLSSLGDAIRDSSSILVLQVKSVSRDKRVIMYETVAHLKGAHPVQQIKHHLSGGLHAHEAEEILDWAEPGKTAVFFHNERIAQTCIGKSWYQCAATKDAAWWTMTRLTVEQSFAYYGSTAKLRKHVQAILEGKQVVVSAIQSRWNRYQSVAMRDIQPGDNYAIWRIKAGLKISGWPRGGEPGLGGPEDVPALVEALRSTDAYERAEAAEELGGLGPAAKAALPALQRLKDADGVVGVQVVRALARIDPDVPSADLLKEAQKRGGELALISTWALALVEGDYGAAVPLLLRGLQGPRQGYSYSFSKQALLRLGPEAKAAVPHLVEALKEKTVDVRLAAASVLDRIGPEAQAAIPALQQRLKDEHRAVRTAAANALARIQRQN